MNNDLYDTLLKRINCTYKLDKLLNYIFERYKKHYMYFIFNKNIIIFTIGDHKNIYIVCKKRNKYTGRLELNKFLRYLIRHNEFEIQKYLFDNNI